MGVMGMVMDMAMAEKVPSIEMLLLITDWKKRQKLAFVNG